MFKKTDSGHIFMEKAQVHKKDTKDHTLYICAKDWAILYFKAESKNGF